MRWLAGGFSVTQKNDKLFWAHLEDVTAAGGLSQPVCPTRQFLDEVFAREAVPMLERLVWLIDRNVHFDVDCANLRLTAVSELLGTLRFELADREYVDALLYHDDKFVGSFVEPLHAFISELLLWWLFFRIFPLYEALLNSQPDCNQKSLFQAIRPLRQYSMN